MVFCERSEPCLLRGVLCCIHVFMNRNLLQVLVMPALATLFFFALTLPIWRWLWREWMGNDYYSHGVLVPLVSLFLAVQRFRHDKSIRNLTPSNPTFGLLILAASVGLFLLFLNAKAYYVAAFAMIGVLFGGIWSFAGLPVVRILIFPIGYLALMVPLPFVERSTLPLAMFTGVCAGNIVKFLGLDVTIVGNAVTLPNANLVIGAQCSGVNSLIALTSLMTLAAYLLDGPLWGRLTLALMAIPLAILGNILRVASLLFVARAYGADAAFTYYHDYSCLVFFAGVLLLMFPLTRILQARSFRFEVI
jgi:exosortase